MQTQEAPRLLRSSNAEAPDFSLANWMQELGPLLANQTLLDLSLPGTHDTMTYDLSTTFSDNAEDIPSALSWILHTFGSEIPTVGNFGRDQSKTQGLDITAQLNAGIRFIDFRIGYTRNSPFGLKSAWYNLHFMQSQHDCLYHFQEVRSWLDAHPGEIVVFWLSKHGSECATGEDQYPGVSTDEKRKFWAEIENVFQGLLFNRDKGDLNSTTIKEMLALNQRVVIYAADYSDFTANSTLAYDSCLIDNRLGSGVDTEIQAYASEINEFKTAAVNKVKSKAQNKLILRSMATSGGGTQIEDAFLLRYFGAINAKKNREECAATLHIPNLTDWCPPALLHINQLANYYKQLTLEEAHLKGWDIPTIYIDAVDLDGTIRTGTTVLGGSDTVSDHEATRYPYVDTLLAANIRRACQSGVYAPEECSRLKTLIEERRKKYPLEVWKDEAHGRLIGWPVTTSQQSPNSGRLI